MTIPKKALFVSSGLIIGVISEPKIAANVHFLQIAGALAGEHSQQALSVDRGDEKAGFWKWIKKEPTDGDSVGTGCIIGPGPDCRFFGRGDSEGGDSDGRGSDGGRSDRGGSGPHN